MYCIFCIIFLLKVFEDGLSSSQVITSTSTLDTTTLMAETYKEINNSTALAKSEKPPNINTEGQTKDEDNLKNNTDANTTNNTTISSTVKPNNTNDRLTRAKLKINKFLQTTATHDGTEADKQLNSQTSNYGRLTPLMAPLLNAGTKLNSGISEARKGIHTLGSASYSMADSFMGFIKDGAQNMGKILSNPRFLRF